MDLNVHLDISDTYLFCHLIAAALPPDVYGQLRFQQKSLKLGFHKIVDKLMIHRQKHIKQNCKQIFITKMNTLKKM